MEKTLVLIRGAGDLASGVAWRLRRCGFPVVMTELELPLVVRRTVAFAQAVFDGETVVDGIRARRVALAEVASCLAQGIIPVLVDPAGEAVRHLQPRVLVDGIMAKRNLGTRREQAPLVIALGPGFTAGVDCHAVVETNRGHHLGRVFWQGSAEPDTGEPGALPGVGVRATRVLRAPMAGFVKEQRRIGESIRQGEWIATVWDDAGRTAAIHAPFTGVLRGIIHPTVPVTPGMKIGDLDPRAKAEYCYSVSDKSLAIAGGVLEAILSAGRGATAL
ncbi:EF2563 family selenium-dependent molybdenum hydroxylase system protein [Litorilinea aerophila]|nr:selenium-dependent molybdenum cofactor biosynthesis protein YqeB [Litorilinea aerophila]MCC9078027.1 EF2563 family selenium-dependent molybdenum hydroxylase system protein [Litorilinea aerophila]OUC06170.1 hypothetical protein RY27_22725 [Litorilinea aerophila]GIV75980.1 MAG: molybdenum hydroxylase [Litorilinea sp.]